MAAEVTSEEQYDLTSVIGGYLDRHLVFPMLEFLSEKKVATYLHDRLYAFYRPLVHVKKLIMSYKWQ